MTKFWVSWWHKEEYDDFNLKWPCWLTGQCGDTPTERFSYCAAVKVEPGKDVLSVITDSYKIEPNDLVYIEFRFVIQKPDDWTPYSCDRFQSFGEDDDAEKFWNEGDEDEK